jgi:L-aminopeptidase/D-esterase-like protein
VAATNRLAVLAHDGLALAIRPAHTHYDGDTLFGLALPAPGAPSPDLLGLGAAAAEVVAEAVLRAVRAARSLHGVPAIADGP